MCVHNVFLLTRPKEAERPPMTDLVISQQDIIERILTLELVRVTERAAVSSARWRGRRRWIESCAGSVVGRLARKIASSEKRIATTAATRTARDRRPVRQRAKSNIATSGPAPIRKSGAQM